MKARFGLLPLIVVVCACNKAQTLANPNDTQQVSNGKIIYGEHCARCHGADLKGDPQWRVRKPDGKMPAPPHDESGHTWHHPDALLFGIIKNGLVPPYGPPNYPSDMPAFDKTLSDQQIWDVLAYLKSTWPDDIRNQQAQIDREAQK